MTYFCAFCQRWHTSRDKCRFEHDPTAPRDRDNAPPKEDKSVKVRVYDTPPKDDPKAEPLRPVSVRPMPWWLVLLALVRLVYGRRRG